MKRALLLPLLASGCIEYEPTSTLPPVGAFNPRNLEVPHQVDTLTQAVSPEVDVLWVVDNSCSMSQEQFDVSDNAPSFLDFFLGSGLEYHIGVVSTDMPNDQGRLIESGGLKWIEPDTPDVLPRFQSMIELGNGGYFPEKGIDAAYAALEFHHDGENAGFERLEAALHVIVISDEADHSENINVSEFVDFMKTRKWAEDMVSFSSIVAPPGNVCPSAGSAGTDYMAVSDAVGGVVWSICSTDWQDVLEQLGLQASGARSEYFLSQLPIPDTIEVQTIDELGVTRTFVLDQDFTYNATRNSIFFTEYVPSPLAKVIIDYDTASGWVD